MNLTTSDFDYELPEAQIAQYPLQERTTSRLLALDIQNNQIKHNIFKYLIDFLNPNDLLVLNDTRVIPARLLGHKMTGGKVECLVERILPEHQVLAQLRASKSPRTDSNLLLEDAIEVTVLGRQQEFFVLQFPREPSVLEQLQQYGRIPLPNYMERAAETVDQQRYQTVYAAKDGAVAAPTAGLHFDQQLLQDLAAKGIQFSHVTLHVGAGTFQPVRVENLDEHHMHREYLEVSRETCETIQRCKQAGGRVIAVGTTVVRCLETAASAGSIQPYAGETHLFIRPGYQFCCIDGLITNFHLPKSTLLMLVCAFAGYQTVMQAYAAAVREGYRFFSYGDAMLLL